jgi:hypothetical protein
VEKYLTRKARNYFLIFKNNTLKSEINIWKSKYTESIKSKILSDVLSSIFLKTKYYAYNTLTNYHHFTNKIDSFVKIFSKCQSGNLQTAFNKIKCDGHAKLLDICDRIYNSIREDQIRDAFNLLKTNRMVVKMNDTIIKVITKNLLGEGFTRINRRKERIIKSRLSIILL